MPLWLTLALGTGLGLGVWLIVAGLWPARPPLTRLFAVLNAPAAPPPIITAGGEAGWAAPAGRPFTGLLRGLGLPTPPPAGTWPCSAAAATST